MDGHILETMSKYTTSVTGIVGVAITAPYFSTFLKPEQVMSFYAGEILLFAPLIALSYLKESGQLEKRFPRAHNFFDQMLNPLYGLTPEDIERIRENKMSARRQEKELFAEIDGLGWKQRVLGKTRYAGWKYNIWNPHRHVDDNGNPQEQIHLMGIAAMNVALPYYAARESLVSLKRRL